MIKYKGFDVPETREDVKEIIRKEMDAIKEMTGQNGSTPSCFVPTLCVYHADDERFLNVHINLEDIDSGAITVEGIADRIKEAVDNYDLGELGETD